MSHVRARRTCHVLIVGGGLAGVTAALECSRAGLEVTLLEARSKLGGRASSVTCPETGEDLDLGQHLFIGAFKQTLALLESLGTRHLLKSPPARYVMMDEKGRRHCMDLLNLPGSLFMLGTVKGLDHLSWKERALLARVAWAVKSAGPYEQAVWDHTDSENWLKRHGQSQSVIECFWKPMILSALNAPPDEVSAWSLAVVLKNGFFAGPVRAAPLIAVKGLSRLFEEPAVDELGRRGANVVTSTKVVGLEVHGRRVFSLQDAAGNCWKAADFVFAVPPWSLEQLDGGAELLNGTGYSWSSSPILTIHAWFDRPLFKDAFVGFLNGPVHWAFNHGLLDTVSSAGGHWYTFVTSSAAEEMSLPKDELVGRNLQALRQRLPGAGRARLVRWKVFKERRATVPPIPGQWMSRPGPRTPFENTFLAGDWTSTGLPPTMESAIVSGNRAAHEVMERAGRTAKHHQER